MAKSDNCTQSIQRNFEKLKQNSNEDSLDFYGPGHPCFVLIELYKAMEDPDYQINGEAKKQLVIIHFLDQEGYIYPCVREVLNKFELSGDFSPFAFDCFSWYNC